MINFEYGFNIIDLVIDELKQAKKYIKMAIFQLHNTNVFNILNNLLKNKVKLTIFTLPYDSINIDVKDNVIENFENLIKNGAEILFCKWNVGDPERTSTAIGRWYSFHGKFIITDTCAISLSANLTNNKELDAAIFFKNDLDKINEFNIKFNDLVNLYVKENSGYNGNLREIVINSGLSPSELFSLFTLPRVIESKTHINNWIAHYPINLCPSIDTIENKLYITPFDCRGRDFIYLILSKAKKYIYICSESFTDDDFSNFLIKHSLNNIEIKVLCGDTSMDYQDKMVKMFKKLLSNNIKLRTSDEEIHAKLIITDNYLLISSVNLNKMNLGFYITSKYWRENTETLCVISEKKIINDALKKYNLFYEKSLNIEIRIAEKIEKRIGNIYKIYFNTKSKKEVKELFSKFIIQKEIEIEKSIIKIAKISSILSKNKNKQFVDTIDFLSALILFFLTDRKHDFNSLKDKLSEIKCEDKLTLVINYLIKDNYIESEDDYYKIKLLSLFK